VGEVIRFGSYELRALLGQGGMAKVYRAVRMGPHGFAKEVALKILDPNATATQDQISQLTDEARVGGMLRHPNIVATDELGQVGPFYYIAMELVDGWPLDRLLRQHRDKAELIPLPIVLDVLIGICKGLEYVHSLLGRDGEPLKLVHRDMKPGNIMVSRNGIVKIMDFGIAKATTNLYTTQEASTRGTPLFMSPEQVSGGDLDGRSDLFSVGSMLQELVTLEKTFAGEELIPILRAVLEVDTEGAEKRLAVAAPSLLPVFQRCTQADPDDRYPDAAALRRDLEALREREASDLSIPTWLKKESAWLPVATDGELGEMLPGVIVVVDDSDGGNDTVSLPMQSVTDVPSQFEMPLGPSAGPAKGAPRPSEDSIASLNWTGSVTDGDGPPPMPAWMASATFMRPSHEPASEPLDPPSPAFVKPGRPLAPSRHEATPVRPPPPSVPADPAANPALPPGHPLYRHNRSADTSLPTAAAPTLPRARPEARPLSMPATAVPRPNSRPSGPPVRPRTSPARRAPSRHTASTHQAGDALPRGRRLLGSLVRITLALAVFGALVYSYSFVPGAIGDIAREIMSAAALIAKMAGVELPSPN